MKPRSPTFQDIELDIVGSNVYGRYAKISQSSTWNMLISDNWLVPYAGYQIAQLIANNGVGRGIYPSVRQQKLFLAIGNTIYSIATGTLLVATVGTIGTFVGDVFFAEDNGGNIAICDKLNIWIYNVPQGTFQQATFSGWNPAPRPGYIAFQDTRFISVDLNSSNWFLSNGTTNSDFPHDAQHFAPFQTKSDIPIAAIPLPGKSNMLLILGSIVGQIWQDVGATLFPYQLVTGVNIDYGCLSSDTIAYLDNVVCWLGANDRSGPVILVSTGGPPERISTDGIDFQLASLSNPSDSHAFMFRQDGHLIYHITFVTDNLTFMYDFNTQKFFSASDTYMNYHPAKKIAYFNNTHYFVNLQDSNLYEMNSTITTYNGNEIPRVRVCKTIRMPNTTPFVINNLSFPIEQGFDGTQYNPDFYQPAFLTTENFITLTTENNIPIVTETINQTYSTTNPPLPRVDLSVSYNGGYDFTSYEGLSLNPIGLRKNRFIYYNLGYANEFTPQFRFWSMGRIVAGNGTMSVYQ